jgi:hypothetical protein
MVYRCLSIENGKVPPKKNHLGTLKRMNIRGSSKTWAVWVKSDYLTKSRNAYGQNVALPYYSLSFALDEQVSLQTIYFQGLSELSPSLLVTYPLGNLTV